MQHILINATHKEEIRVGVVKNQKLINLNIETSLNQKNKGNIYYGKISRIESSLEAAFVDYGKDKQGFLPFKEVADYLKTTTKNKNDKPSISNVLSEGQGILVQVEKEERGNKGAALTTNINLAGTYMIITPYNNKSTGISRQINNSNRQKLKAIVNELKIPKEYGIIIRTAASGKELNELQWEVDYLVGVWGAIKNAYKDTTTPTLIYQESNIIVRTIRDYLRDYVDSIMLDNKEAFNQAYNFVSMVLPHYLDKIKFFEATNYSLFEYMKVEKQIQNIFKREVALQSGATIVFDPTEALTAIDINSARATKGSNIADTAYNTNLTAAKEISMQLQLRDIGGLIVIDFIDMDNEEHKNAIVNAIKQHTANDKARIQIGEISQFGLLEMSRQRLMSSVIESTEITCKVCEGRGTVPTIPFLALTILRKIIHSCTNKKSLQEVTIQSAIEVITYLLNEKRTDINNIEIKYKVKITLLPNQYIQFPEWNISYNNKKTSYKRITKQKNNIADNGLNSIPEEAIIRSYMPKTRKPTKETPQGLLTKLKKIFVANTNNKPKHNKYKKRNNRRK